MTTDQPLTLAEVLALPALVPLWPTVGRALGLGETTTYQLAANNELPIEVIRLGRTRKARTADLIDFLRIGPVVALYRDLGLAAQPAETADTAA